jgi:hypothetical protein
MREDRRSCWLYEMFQPLPLSLMLAMEAQENIIQGHQARMTGDGSIASEMKSFSRQC